MCLFGDSILDNTIWLRNSQNTVESQIRTALGPSVELQDYTIDGLTVEDMLKRPNCQTRLYFSMHRALQRMPPYALLNNYSEVPPHDAAVLCIGGNDVRKYLGRHAGHRQWSLFLRMLRKRIAQVVQQLLAPGRAGRLVLILPYVPFFSTAIYRLLGVGFNEMVEVAHLYYREMARLRGPKVSLLGLLNDSHPGNLNDFASTPIEPSESLGARIAKRVAQRLAAPHDWPPESIPSKSRIRALLEEARARNPSMVTFLWGWRGQCNLYILGVMLLTSLAWCLGWKPRPYFADGRRESMSSACACTRG